MAKIDKNGNEYVIGAYVYYTDVDDSSKNDVGIVVEAPAYSAYDEETIVWCRWISDGTTKCFFTVDGMTVKNSM